MEERLKALMLLLGDSKEVSSVPQNNSSILSDAIGKYAICRTRNEGINAGKVVAADETGCVLEDARRIYYHKPKDKSVAWYEGVAMTGLSSDSKISTPVLRKYIVEDYSLTICTETAEQSIRSHESLSQ